ncbi:BTAD domain-containing putative transcriptional regulator [Streptomyces sp. NPDC006365]|uniref:AfsR/SARP family transcriptional regulator n=1 Tax=Streptomyces sp. NPDC006365 TaxID=3364744 RepID=UPI0036AE0047
MGVPPVEIGLLGPIQVSVGGEALPLSSLPQRVLLARLALSPQKVVPVADLIDALWSEQPPRGAVGNLHSYVSRLRRVVGGERIDREPAGYRLRLEHDQVDIGRVERQVAAAAATTDPARGAQLLGRALVVWRGEPLADLADRPAFAPERARLAEWHRQLREEWFELRLTAGEAEGVLPDLEEAAAADPLRERVQLLFIRARHQAGRTAEALTVADAYRRRLIEEFGLDPSPAFADLRQRLLADDPGLRARRMPGSSLVRGDSARRDPARQDAQGVASGGLVHRPADRFIGRGPELERVRHALREHRAVTVVGPGGVGKTRLVLELLHRGAGAEPVHLVELAETSTPAETGGVVATALGLRAAPEGSARAVADRLGGEPALLVLDNCEHLLTAARDLVAELLARCPALRVLATSRQRLGVAGERVVRLGPLPEGHQVELFCDRAALLRDGFDASAHTRRLVGEVCHLIDGLPLAVELAARREAAFGLPELRERLSAGLDVLEPLRGGDRSTAVTATVEWSCRLLDPDARALLDRLSVCRGGFGPQALEHLAPVGVTNPAALLAELVDASLVGCDLSAATPRYRLLETVRHVCGSHLTPAEADDARGAHARWMMAHVESIHALQRERSPEATPLLRREAANLHQALSWLADSSKKPPTEPPAGESVHSGRRELAALLGMLTACAQSDEPALPLTTQLLRLAPAVLPPRTESEAVCAVAAGTAAGLAGDAPRAEQLLTAAVERLPGGSPYAWIGLFFRLTNRMFSGDVSGVESDAMALRHDRTAPAWAAATGVCGAALVRQFSGDHAAAARWLARDEALLAEVNPVEGIVAYTRGELAADQDPFRALAWFDEACQRCDAQGQTYIREAAAVGRAAVLIRLGRHSEAAAACRGLVDSLRRLGMWPQLWMVLRLTAELLVALGDHATAAALLTAADGDALAPAVLGTDRDRHAVLWAAITDRLDPHRLAHCRSEGRTDGRAGATERALRALDVHC